MARAQDQPPMPAHEHMHAPEASQEKEEKKDEVKTYTLTPEQYEKAVSYSRAEYRLHFAGVAYLLFLLFALLALGIAPRFRNWAEAVSRRRFVQAMIFVPLLTLALDVLSLPLAIYGHNLALRYDQSIQSWPSWFWDWTKGELVGLVISTVLLYLLYWLIRRSPRRWWLYAGLASLPLIIFFVLLKPIVVDPLFNRFEPLDKSYPQLVTKIEELAAHAGLDIPRERMFEMKASEKLKAMNAYVTGFGASKRVVVWDTTIANMTEPQTLFVVGHEMGHYALGHIPKFIFFISALVIVVSLLVYLSTKWALARWGKRWKVRGADDWASLPALIFFFTLFVFLCEPAGNTFSRYQEREADVYGVEVTHGVVANANKAAAEAFQKLGEIDLADPNPGEFIKFWLYSHPPLAERLEFARDYDPWSKGESPMFVK